MVIVLQCPLHIVHKLQVIDEDHIVDEEEDDLGKKKFESFSNEDNADAVLRFQFTTNTNTNTQTNTQDRRSP